MDGGTRRNSLLRVVLPLSAPGLVITAFYTFILAWNQFILRFRSSQTLISRSW